MKIQNQLDLLNEHLLNLYEIRGQLDYNTNLRIETQIKDLRDKIRRLSPLAVSCKLHSAIENF